MYLYGIYHGHLLIYFSFEMARAEEPRDVVYSDSNLINLPRYAHKEEVIPRLQWLTISALHIDNLCTTHWQMRSLPLLSSLQISNCALAFPFL
jgi:hypothetical protein